MLCLLGQLYDNSADSIEGNVTSEDVDLLQREIDSAEMFLARAKEMHAMELMPSAGKEMAVCPRVPFDCCKLASS